MPSRTHNWKKNTWFQSSRSYALLALLAGLVLWIDLSLPLGVAGGVPYVAVVLFSLWFPSKRLTWCVAIVCSLLTLVGYALSPEGGISWVVATNRLLALFAIWVTTLLSLSRKHHLVEIKESEERFRDIVLSSADWVWEVDAQGKYTYASEKVFDILGYQPSEIIGKTPFELMPPEEADRIEAFFNNLAKKGEPIRELENWNLAKDGFRVCLLTNGTPIIDKYGALVGYRGMNKDITESKQTIEALDKALKLAESSNRAKDQFLANMSHELRTPLTVINGSTEVLLEEVCGGINEKQRAFLNRMSASGTHLLTIINDVLELARFEAGKMTLDLFKVDLSSITREVCEMLAPQIDNARLELKLDGFEQSAYLKGDHLRLRQVMLNLLSNAIKFTKRGTITIYFVRGEEELKWGVRDTGIGIAKDKLDLLFKRFEQAGDVLHNKAPGTGLGLALSKHVVEAHGGRIMVTSEIGKGSDFCVVLPRKISPGYQPH